MARFPGSDRAKAILGRVVEAIETRQPGALAAWLRGSAALSPLPKGWSVPPAPPARPSAVRALPLGQTSQPAPSEEAREADRIAGAVRAALEGAPDFPLFAERLAAAGVLMRPVINGELALHGVRFSTRTASFTGGALGLTGPALERAGAAYRHPEHAGLVARLVTEHDRVMGPVTALKGRFTAVPGSAPPPQTAEARERMRALIAEALPGAASVFDLADRLERLGIRTETRINTARMRVSSVLFVAEGARVPGTSVGLGPKDKTPDFWSLVAPTPVRMGADGTITAPSSPRPQPSPPDRIGEGLNEGVTELILAINDGALEISPETVLSVKCGMDGWSRLSESALLEVIGREAKPEEVETGIAPLSGADRTSALRWVCRGLRPDLACDLHLTRAVVYEARNAERARDPMPEP